MPADARLIQANELSLDLSVLTGESQPVARHADAIDSPPAAKVVLIPTRERANLVLAGTSVAGGRGEAIVYATGGETEFGHVAHLTAATPRGVTTLEEQVGHIVRTITVIALVMGVINLTPDSFSDGGRYLDPERALERAREMVAEGADILDLGAESTRPGAAPVPVEEEKRRLLPVLEAVLSLGVPVSVDTRKPEVAEEALKLGAHLLNDVTGLRDERMVALAARHGVAAVVMHMPVPDPATMMAHARYRDVVAEVKAFLEAQARRALSAGVPQVVLDPGFGFGKLLEHNLALLRRLDEIVALGHPVLVGLSRKRTIGELSGVEDPAQRVHGSVAAHLFAVMKGVRLLRVHDVRAHREALGVWEALYGGDRPSRA